MIEDKVPLLAPASHRICDWRTSVRVVVAEDDSAQAEYLSGLVNRLRPGWLVTVVADIPALRLAVEQVVPHILVLDLHMPGGTDAAGGMEYLQTKPRGMSIILVTGDAKFGVEAFTLEVDDYLVKPVKPARFHQALERAGARLWATSAPDPAIRKRQWINATKGLDTVVVMVDDIVYFQAQQRYTRILLAEGEAQLHMGIADVEAMVSGDGFSRVHRSTIVNLRHIKFARRDSAGRLRLHLHDRDESLVVSRTFEALFKTY